ncbi:hypothetical protein SDC9_190775 [bioreactor metagenome]|uniref:Uncharacterized protein n=1 Tax=bioreactor metagenome TaxID=1076179 RepID=A0A645HXA0_9ZZZZ
MRGKLFAGSDAPDKAVDLGLEMVCGGKLGGSLKQHAVFRGVDFKVGSVLQANPRFVADEVNVHFIHADILRPCAVDRYRRAFGPDHGGDKIIDIVYAFIVRGAGPHINVGIIFHVESQLGESLAGYGKRLGIAEAIHNNIDKVDSPVD